MLDWQTPARALRLARPRMGSNIAIRSEMIEMTVNSSINVKPFRLHIGLLLYQGDSGSTILISNRYMRPKLANI